ncbi:PAS domain S-box protein [Sunxiuqinia sp. A32]|uniref:PAS domain S-box protein n=1 Tax=Sunxiuqinia sp. A32 TaxID=3461496 RepID=UPI004045DACB
MNGTMKDDQLHDVSQLQKENQQLREELESMREKFAIRSHLLENSPVLAWMVDTDFKFIYLSNSFLKGYGALANVELKIGQNILEVIKPKYVADWEIRLKKAIGGEHITFEEIISNDNTTKHFQMTISPIIIEGKISGVQVFINEITRLVEAEKKEDSSLKKLQQIFNQLQDLYYEVELDGTITELSPAVKNISGYTREELIGKDVSNLYSNAEERERFLDKIRQDGKVQNYVINFNDKDKRSRRMALSATLILSDNKEPQKIVGMMRDVTELEVINKSLSWFRRAIEHSPISIIITDRNGKIEYTNPFFSKTTGYKYSEVVGKNPSIFKTSLHPRSYYKELWKTISNGEIWQGEFRNKQKDGGFFWEKATIAPVKNSNGDISNYIAIKENFTEKKQATAEIKRLKSFNDRIINTMQEGILVEDGNGTVLFTNPAFTTITGYNTDELIGKEWNFLIKPSHQKLVDEANQRKKKNKSDSIEIELITKEGESVPVIFGGSPIFEENKYSGLVAVFTDISKQKENQKNLKKALKQAQLSDKLKSSFLANMSHEIRTPMNAILGFAGILREERELDEDLREEYFSIIEDKGNDLLQIISDVIDISKIESKIIDIKNEEIQLNQFLKELFSNFEKEASINNSKVKLTLNTPLKIRTVKAYADKHRLTQVINNLLNNAMKFTDEGEIELGYEITNKDYLFHVRDTGIGISSKNTKIIFERFRQADDNYTRSFGGTGLGLNICKKLLKLMGGKIWVESVVGKGSTFYFTLPITHKDITST